MQGDRKASSRAQGAESPGEEGLGGGGHRIKWDDSQALASDVHNLGFTGVPDNSSWVQWHNSRKFFAQYFVKNKTVSFCSWSMPFPLI